MNFVEMMTEKDTLTKNGAITNSTSHNYNLDLFFLAGACRNESERNIFNLLAQSYDFDRVKTLKIIFWAGDIRQGAGERRFFKLALNWLYNHHKTDLLDYLDYVPEFSRWDVLFDFIDDDVVMNFIITKFKEGNSLLCKWLPRKSKVTDKRVSEKKNKDGSITKTITTKTRSVKNGLALKIRQKLGWNEKQYRQHLVKYTKVVETDMCANNWNKIEYSHVPSVAMNKYNKAWYRHDATRFEKYLEDVKAGKSKMNASAIFPHDIIKKAISYEGWYATCNLNEAQITQWNSLPNWITGVNSILPVCDTSGSMEGLPMEICLGLGIYISERNVGPFKDAFITFSEQPEFQVLKGDINDRINQLARAHWSGNTDLNAVFDLILSRATVYNLPAQEMPKTILIISDMEFDDCGYLTNYENIKRAYLKAGYNCPNIVFWNVNGRVKNVPVTINDRGVALISGASPSIIKAVLTNDINPVTIMNNVIESDRYNFIK